MSNNMRVIMNTLEYYEAHLSKKMGPVFLDAQKAFNNVNWDFMTKQIEEIGFGQKFKGVPSGIYSPQKARIKVNGELNK